MTISFVHSMVLPGSGAKDFKKCKSWTDEVWETYERITGKPRPEFFRGLKKADGPIHNDASLGS
jgi:hypothetical protein